MKIENIKNDLLDLASKEKSEFFPRFFKTGKGEYGEGDQFIGVTVPNIRKIAKGYKDIQLEEISKLLNDPVHEYRLCALLILCDKYSKAQNEINRKEIYEFYLAHTEGVNNWDLVDASSHYIVGKYLSDKNDRQILYKLAQSESLWEQRISVISTFIFIKNKDFKDIINLSEIFLTHKHDLMHKAVGWMLREVGKQDKKTLTDFLDLYYKIMPRTMLRYSIEKLSQEEKAHYMKK